MRGFLLLIGMLFFSASMYLFYHPELLQMEKEGITGYVVDNRPLLDKITASIHKPVDLEEAVQMTPVVLLFLSVVFTFSSLFIPYGER